MRRVPLHGCEHVGTMLFATREAQCTRCGAFWTRGPDGHWRLEQSGSEPATIGFRCSGCGAEYRDEPRTCLACGRPARGRYTDPAPAEHADAGMRAD